MVRDGEAHALQTQPDPYGVILKDQGWFFVCVNRTYPYSRSQGQDVQALTLVLG